MQKSEIKLLVKKATQREQSFIKSCETGSQAQNPQVVTMRQQAEGRLIAFEAINQALAGDLVDLKILAGA